MKTVHVVLLCTILFLGFIASDIQAQVPRYIRQLINIDSIAQSVGMPVLVSKEVYVFPKESSRKYGDKRYSKLVRNFIVVYPYALMIKQEMAEIEKHLITLPDEKSRRQYIDKKDRELKAEYKKPLMKLTLSQGVMLVKLVDRETGNSSYELIKQLKGSLTAFFWQNIALLFNNNLKVQYDADGKDQEIEMLVRRYETGTL